MECGKHSFLRIVQSCKWKQGERSQQTLYKQPLIVDFNVGIQLEQGFLKGGSILWTSWIFRRIDDIGVSFIKCQEISPSLDWTLDQRSFTKKGDRKMRRERVDAEWEAAVRFLLVRDVYGWRKIALTVNEYTPCMEFPLVQLASSIPHVH